MKTFQDYDSEAFKDKEHPDSNPPTWADAVAAHPASQQKILEFHKNQQENGKKYPGMDNRRHETVVLGNSTNMGTSQAQAPVTKFEYKAMQVVCFQCQNSVSTVTKASPNALCLLCFGMCSLCFDQCQDVEHRCPVCSTFLGIYKPSL